MTTVPVSDVHEDACAGSPGGAGPTHLTLPAYMVEFRCLGGSCPETCCSGWSVHVDRATYDRYMAVQVEDLRSLLRAHVHLVPEPSGRNDHAVIETRDTGVCGLLASDGLCRVQSELGEAHLSDVCHQFPREYQLAGRTLSMAGSFACPEVARLALEGPAALRRQVVDWRNERAPEMSRRRRRATPGMGLAADIGHPEADAVQASSALIAEAARAMVSRAQLHPRFAWEYFAWAAIEALSAARRAHDKADAVRAIREGLSSASAHGVAEQVARARGTESVDTVFRMLRFVDKTVREVSDRGSALASAKVLPDAWAALGFDADDAQGSVERYRTSRVRWFLPFEMRHSHVLRNWLLNQIELHAFPAAGTDGLQREVTGILLRTMLVEVLLVARAAQSQHEFGLDDCATVTHAVARHVEHERAYQRSALMGRLPASTPREAV